MSDKYTTYSCMIAGDARNHARAVRFDNSGGYVGISEKTGEVWTGRVLLTPNQLQALLAFVKDTPPHAR